MICFLAIDYLSRAGRQRPMKLKFQMPTSSAMMTAMLSFLAANVAPLNANGSATAV
jgi:hypothetical protein